MDREQTAKLIKEAKRLRVKVDDKMLSLWQAGRLNGGQETYFIRQLESGIEQKKTQPLSCQARDLIKKAQELGVEKKYYEFLSRPGSLPSSLEVKLMSELRNRIEDKRQEISNKKGGDK